MSVARLGVVVAGDVVGGVPADVDAAAAAARGCRCRPWCRTPSRRPASGTSAGSQHAQALDVDLHAGLEARHHVALVVDAHPQRARLGRGCRRGRGRRRTWAGPASRRRRGCCRTWPSRGTSRRRRRWPRPRCSSTPLVSPQPTTRMVSPVQSRFSRGTSRPSGSSGRARGARARRRVSRRRRPSTAGVPVVKPTITPAVTPTRADTRSADRPPGVPAHDCQTRLRPARLSSLVN